MSGASSHSAQAAAAAALASPLPVAPAPAAAAPASAAAARLPNVILFGTGEYTTGYVAGACSTSDKPMGVVALTFFDLRARGLIGSRITLCGRSGARAAGIKQHLRETIAATYGLDVECELVPSDPKIVDPLAYLKVLDGGLYRAGDIAVVTTPDDTHMPIALACIQRGIHCIIAKPIVQSLEEHWTLIRAAEAYRAASASNSLVLVGEFHKRFDPIYSDAVSKISSGALGQLSYVHAYMSQPKSQLKTFQSWLVSGGADPSSASAAASSARPAPSDISFYLNSHHIDLLNLSVWEKSKPIWVQAISAKGYANAVFNPPTTQIATTTDALQQQNGAAKAKRVDIEDTITVTVQYETLPAAAAPVAGSSTASAPASSEGPTYGIGVFTSSWIAPRSDVHSQQRFHFLGTVGELQVDQAHRGYTIANDDNTKGLQSANPLFMRYQPNTAGRFVGQQGYGYKSFEHFIEQVTGRPNTAITEHANIESSASLYTTAILQAARRSLDGDNRKVHIRYDEQRRPRNLE